MILADETWSAVIVPVTLLLLYSASAWLMLRSASNRRLEPYAWILCLGAIGVHSDAIFDVMRAVGPFSIGLREAISLLAWTLAVLACLIALERQYRVLAAILLWSAALGAAATGDGHKYRVDAVPAWELSAHILLSMAAAALLFAAAVTASMLVLLDRRLRARRIAKLPHQLPPMDVLEKVMFRLIGSGFALLTLSLFTGFVFVTNLFEQHLVHKTVLSLMAWVVFAILLIGRVRYGWRGRFAVRLTLAGFVLLALAYFGSKFVLEYIFGRQWG
ncbi:MAG: cytochrome c biogenesis protein CcsA [Steroidobacteraceae bacterium]|nr:cytochrome c biogenesis protein CcsA [Steroidobacteraceae bacterium]